MATGTVKWFNPTKGYGFIQPSGGGGKDVFVHISAVERAGLRSLNEGQTIEYEIESNRGKDSAVNLKGQVAVPSISAARALEAQVSNRESSSHHDRSRGRACRANGQ
jgi:CspA family cold shock protein